jgi:tetratricopeptide (TPR) repeat protein
MSCWSRKAIRYAACLGLALVAGSAAAQIPDRFTNLKVLPASIKKDDLLAIMGSFTRALGVNCTHCHVAADGRRPASAEFALDVKETKQVARTMLRMVDEINSRHLPETGRERAKLQRVSCTTCHGGLTKPRPLEAVLLEAHATGGVDAAVKRYRELRQEHFGRRGYDFSDITLVSAAGEIAERNLADALALMRLNLEFHPESWFTYQQMGRLQERAGDTTAALASYRKALEINPSRAFVRELLESLEAKQRGKQ